MPALIVEATSDDEETGACTDCTNGTQYPIHRSAALGHSECLTKIVANLDTADLLLDSENNTPLHAAAAAGQVETLTFKPTQLNTVIMVFCRYMMKNTRIPLNVKNDNGITCAHVAAERSRLGVLEILLGGPLHVAQAIAFERDSHGRTCLHYALLAKDNDIALWLLRRFGKSIASIPDEHKVLPLHMAAAQGNIEFLRIATKFDLTMASARDDTGATPVFYSVQAGHRNCVQFLIDKVRSDIDALTFRGQSLLHAACLNGDPALVHFLLGRMAKSAVFRPTSDGATAFHFAAFRGNPTLLKMLFKAANNKKQMLNSFDRNGNTPIHLAVLNGHLVMTQLLLNLGADPRVRNKVGRTPAMLAEETKNVQLRVLFDRPRGSDSRKIHSRPSKSTSKTSSESHVLIKSRPRSLNALHLNALGGDELRRKYKSSSSFVQAKSSSNNSINFAISSIEDIQNVDHKNWLLKQNNGPIPVVELVDSIKESKVSHPRLPALTSPSKHRDSIDSSIVITPLPRTDRLSVSVSDVPSIVNVDPQPTRKVESEIATKITRTASDSPKGADRSPNTEMKPQIKARSSTLLVLKKRFTDSCTQTIIDPLVADIMVYDDTDHLIYSSASEVASVYSLDEAKPVKKSFSDKTEFENSSRLIHKGTQMSKKTAGKPPKTKRRVSRKRSRGKSHRRPEAIRYDASADQSHLSDTESDASHKPATLKYRKDNLAQLTVHNKSDPVGYVRETETVVVDVETLMKEYPSAVAEAVIEDTNKESNNPSDPDHSQQVDEANPPTIAETLKQLPVEKLDDSNPYQHYDTPPGYKKFTDKLPLIETIKLNENDETVTNTEAEDDQSVILPVSFQPRGGSEHDSLLLVEAAQAVKLIDDAVESRETNNRWEEWSVSYPSQKSTSFSNVIEDSGPNLETSMVFPILVEPKKPIVVDMKPDPQVAATSDYQMVINQLDSGETWSRRQNELMWKKPARQQVVVESIEEQQYVQPEPAPYIERQISVSNIPIAPPLPPLMLQPQSFTSVKVSPLPMATRAGQSNVGIVYPVSKGSSSNVSGKVIINESAVKTIDTTLRHQRPIGASPVVDSNNIKIQNGNDFGNIETDMTVYHQQQNVEDKGASRRISVTPVFNEGGLSREDAELCGNRVSELRSKFSHPTTIKSKDSFNTDKYNVNTRYIKHQRPKFMLPNRVPHSPMVSPTISVPSVGANFESLVAINSASDAIGYGSSLLTIGTKEIRASQENLRASSSPTSKSSGNIHSNNVKVQSNQKHSPSIHVYRI